MKNFTVLLIEPDLILADIYKNHLEKFHYKVNICGNVEQAIHVVDKQKPDIIVLELQLANHNGYEFLYELRSYTDWQDIPILIHSVLPEEDSGLNESTKKQLGITSYLYKPATSLGKLHYELNKQLLTNKI
jgi:DNA-binding response OmpR family regulator